MNCTPSNGMSMTISSAMAGAESEILVEKRYQNARVSYVEPARKVQFLLKCTDFCRESQKKCPWLVQVYPHQLGCESGKSGTLLDPLLTCPVFLTNVNVLVNMTSTWALHPMNSSARVVDHRGRFRLLQVVGFLLACRYGLRQTQIG